MASAERWYAAIVSTVVLGAVISPIVPAEQEDGFPLSNYPMFSRAPDDSRVALAHVVGWSSRGEHRPIEPGLVETEEVMQAMQTIKVAAQKGAAAAADLCTQTAARVAEDDDYADIDTLEVRTDRYDVLTYFSEGRAPLATQVHARCAVVRGGAR